MNLTYKDINTRQKNLVVDSHTPLRVNPNTKYLYESLSSNYSLNSVKLILNDWRSLSESELLNFERVLDVFMMVCENSSVYSITNIANVIEGEIIPKLRDGKATRHLNNYKLGKFKIQNTKAQNHNNDNNNAVKTAMANKGYLPNTLHPNRKYKRDIYGRKMGEIEKKEEETSEKNKAIKEAYEAFDAALDKNIQCDRVLDNHNTLTRQFNLESKVRNCRPGEMYIQSCIYEICELIDTHDISFPVKYNVALENISYLMHKNCVKVSDRFIIESVTDYFLYSRDTTRDILEGMDDILANSHFFAKEDVDYARLLFGDDISEDIFEGDELDSIIHEGSIDKDNEEIKKIIKDFKKAEKKTVSLLNTCINRIFVKPPELIIKNIPDIFDAVRACVIFGLIYIHPIIGILGTITGFFLKMQLGKKEMDRVVNQYYKEKDKYIKKKNEAKDDKTKEKYDKIIKELEDDISKLEQYEEQFNSDDAMSAKRDERYDKYQSNSDIDLGDFDFDFDDDDFNLEHCINIVSMMSELTESFLYTPQDLSRAIMNNIDSSSASDIYELTESVVLCSEMFDCTAYVAILEDALLRARTVSGLQKYEKIDAINQCIRDVKDVMYNNLISTANESASPELIYSNLIQQINVVNDTMEFFTRRSITEGKSETVDKGLSFTSKLKIAKENLKRTALKLKDKDKELSDKLDNSVDLFTNSAKNSMISQNREAIIKGKLIPSASKCVHLAVASGLAWMINPAIAVIGTLGYIGASKALQAKERRLIFDEIEVEIEMCDKYIRLAEDKNDLQAVRNIMQTKRSLERQRQRLRNGMKTDFKSARLTEKPFHLDKDDVD